MTDQSPDFTRSSEHASLLTRDAKAFFHQEGSSPCLAALRSAQGIYIEDVDGHRLIDLHGNTAHHLGHAHPDLVATLKTQLDTLTFAPRRYAAAPATELAEALLAKWPGASAKVLFATGGSDAIEIALRLVRVTTGRSGTLSLEGSYHGHGFAALGLSSAALDPRLGAQLPGRQHLTPYWRADLGGARAMLNDLTRQLATAGNNIGCLVAEPIRSNCHLPPDWLWPEVRQLCDAHGVALIFDEIPSGLGKTGRFFAFEHFDVVPDAVVLGKSLGGGLLPIAAVIADQKMNVAPDLNLGHYTHEKNPLTTRVALEVLRIIDRDGLVVRAALLGQQARTLIEARVCGGGPICGVRGLGLLLALELDVDRFPVTTTSASQQMVEVCLRHGISTTTKGAAAIGFSPPLVITEDELADAVARVFAAADEAVIP